MKRIGRWKARTSFTSGSCKVASVSWDVPSKKAMMMHCISAACMYSNMRRIATAIIPDPAPRMRPCPQPPVNRFDCSHVHITPGMLKADILDISESSGSEKEVSDAVVGGTSRATSFQGLIEINVDITAMISTITTL